MWPTANCSRTGSRGVEDDLEEAVDMVSGVEGVEESAIQIMRVLQAGAVGGRCEG